MPVYNVRILLLSQTKPGIIWQDNKVWCYR